ncbi:MAG TPA: aromatic ring-hydroxylating dioxygenase subunit alpha [Acidimicrobiales bacterium]|nr:aromatic ring-hydroxylating dioxygenase subunit alpha [Acidimicrobiales bacterium]
MEATLPAWPEPAAAQVPYWVYTNPEVYRREQERIFAGPTWSYVGLACEILEPGDYKTTAIGEVPVVVARSKDGGFSVLVNRCAHRGVAFCSESFGHTRSFTCPYHQWSYGLDGRLLGVPFRRGVRGQGGMPSDFDPACHGLEALAVTERHGVVFASFRGDLPALADYLGTTNLTFFDRVFDGRALRLLGYQRQRVPANWKLMFENIKDPYHASLLHVFLVSFGLFRADNPSATQMDPTGRHSVLVSSRGEQKCNDVTGEIASFREDLVLSDPRLLEVVREFPGSETVVMQTIWPNLIVQQQSNTLATRQLVTRGPDCFELHWTYFGYADDDPDMQTRRLRQANLMGPAGFVSIDDSEVMRLAQLGAHAAARTGHGRDPAALVEMGGRDTTDTDHMVTEAAIRAFYGHYRQAMEL